MCYNCGCELPDEDHGKPENIINTTFEKAGGAMGQSDEEARTNTLALLQKVNLATGKLTDAE